MRLPQAGNLAHLLNHSCAPNCHSRLITVWDAQAPREHVMLFAKVRSQNIVKNV